MPKLWDHQEYAVLSALKRQGFGVFFDMGTGKTATALEIIRRREHQLTLLVVPKTVLVDGAWEREIVRCEMEYLRIVPLSDVSPKMRRTVLLSADRSMPTLVIVNYDIVWRPPLKDVILSKPWSAIILDEAHRIKSAGSKVSKFFAQMTRHHPKAQRLALTGTPTPHSPLDAYGIFRFIDPEVFGTNFDKFRDRYAVMGGFNRYQVLKFQNLDELRAKMAQHSVRAEAKDVLDLPPIQHIYRYAELEPQARKHYRELEKDFITTVNQVDIVVDNVLTKMIRLQQITSGFLMRSEPTGSVIEQVSTAKIELLKDTLESLARTQPVVIFARFRNDIRSITSACDDLGITHGELSGERNDLAQWRDGKTSALIVQIQSGSEGVDFTRASHVIYYSKSYSLGLFEQSVARLHRPGQRSPVVAIHLAIKRSIDTDLDTALRSRKDIVKYVMAVYRFTGEMA